MNRRIIASTAMTVAILYVALLVLEVLGSTISCSRPADEAPAVFHSACAGIRSQDVTGAMQCAQHECAHCHRKASMAGGMLFR